MVRLAKRIAINILPHYVAKNIRAIQYTINMFLHSKMKRIKQKNTMLLKIIRRDIQYPFFLRNKTSDVGTYWDIFFDLEYDFLVRESPRVIIDAGANIGLASIYFAQKFPDAMIIAIEPENRNYDLLKMNVQNYQNIHTIHAALWNECGEIDLLNTGMGDNGFMTAKKNDHCSIKTPVNTLRNKVVSITLDKIMQDYGIETIDILKIDIEGAEKEVFENSGFWIEKTKAIIIELHEKMKDGCCRMFYNKTNCFDAEWIQGENIFLAKDNTIMQGGGGGGGGGGTNHDIYSRTERI